MKKTNFSDFLDNFFSFASPVIIIIPLVVIILALILNFSQPKEPINPKERQIVTSPTTIPSKEQTINLKGPFICDYQNKETSISAFIKNKKIFGQIIQNKSIKFLLDDDCFYYWQNFTGKKICGLAPFLMFFNDLPTSIDSDLIYSLDLLDKKNNKSKEKIDLKEFADYCQKKDFNEKEIFIVPKNVLFENQDLNQLIKK